jgi:hypothetical protein
MKAERASQVQKFTDIPNVGPRIAEDFRRLGIMTPEKLAGKDPYRLYKNMCKITGTRQDPCVLDTYIATVRFMQGGKPLSWWSYTAERKRKYPDL